MEYFYILMVRLAVCVAGCVSVDNLSGAAFDTINQCREQAPALIERLRQYRSEAGYPHRRVPLEWYCIRRERPPLTIHRAECDALGPEQVCPYRTREHLR